MTLTIPITQANPFSSLPRQPRFGCRLFAYMGTGAYPAQDAFIRNVLVEDPKAFKQQVQTDKQHLRNGTSFTWEDLVNFKDNDQGWGLAAYTPNTSEPTIEKSVNSALTDQTFDQTVSQLSEQSPNVLLAHIRAATHGNVSLENTHPFTHAGWTFMHNGHIPTEALQVLRAKNRKRSRLIPQYLPQGKTDSEAAFFYLLTKMQEKFGTLEPSKIPSKDLFDVFRETINDLNDIIAANDQASMLELRDELLASLGITMSADSEVEIAPAFNFVFSDGQRILANANGRKLHMGIRKTGNTEEALLASKPIQPDSSRWDQLLAHLPFIKKPAPIRWVELKDDQAVMMESQGNVIQRTNKPVRSVK